MRSRISDQDPGIFWKVFKGRQQTQASYAEPCISYDMVVRLSVCLSVCLSVRPSVCHTLALRQNDASYKITKSSPTDSPRTLAFGIKNSSRNSKGFTPNEGVKWEWGRKNSQFFSQYLAVSQKRCEIRPKLLLMTNRKSHTPFWLVPKSTTLDDLERPIRTQLQKSCVVRSPPQKFEWR